MRERIGEHETLHHPRVAMVHLFRGMVTKRLLSAKGRASMRRSIRFRSKKYGKPLNYANKEKKIGSQPDGFLGTRQRAPIKEPRRIKVPKLQIKRIIIQTLSIDLLGTVEICVGWSWRECARKR